MQDEHGILFAQFLTGATDVTLDIHEFELFHSHILKCLG